MGCGLQKEVSAATLATAAPVTAAGLQGALKSARSTGSARAPRSGGSRDRTAERRSGAAADEGDADEDERNNNENRRPPPSGGSGGLPDKANMGEYVEMLRERSRKTRGTTAAGDRETVVRINTTSPGSDS